MDFVGQAQAHMMSHQYEGLMKKQGGAGGKGGGGGKGGARGTKALPKGAP